MKARGRSRRFTDRKNTDDIRYEFVVIRYEFEYFSFLFIAVLFSAGNVKKNVFTVFIVPIVTIDAILNLMNLIQRPSHSMDHKSILRAFYLEYDIEYDWV